MFRFACWRTGQTLQTFAGTGRIYHVASHAPSHLLAVCFEMN